MKKIENAIFITQENYVADILERFNMQNNKPSSTPIVMGLKLSKEYCSSNVNWTLYKSMVGSLKYLTATRSNIMYAVILVSRFMETPRPSTPNETKEYGILYSAIDDFRLVGYTDSDWA